MRAPKDMTGPAHCETSVTGDCEFPDMCSWKTLFLCNYTEDKIFKTQKENLNCIFNLKHSKRKNVDI